MKRIHWLVITTLFLLGVSGAVFGQGKGSGGDSKAPPPNPPAAATATDTTKPATTAKKAGKQKKPINYDRRNYQMLHQVIGENKAMKGELGEVKKELGEVKQQVANQNTLLLAMVPAITAISNWAQVFSAHFDTSVASLAALVGLSYDLAWYTMLVVIITLVLFLWYVPLRPARRWSRRRWREYQERRAEERERQRAASQLVTT